MKLIITCLIIFSSICYSQDFWTKINTEIQGTSCLVVRANGDIVAGSNGNGVYYSGNNGNSWEMANQGLTDLHINTLFINYSGDYLENPEGDIFAGTHNGVFRSSDDGSSWIKVNSNSIESVLSFAMNSIGDLFAATWGSGIIWSGNYGVVWHELNNGLMDPIVRSIVINSDDQIFVGTTNNHLARIRGIYCSGDGGENWDLIKDKLSVWDLKINNKGDIFAATRGQGVYRSIDNGDSWTSINNGLSDTLKVYCLTIGQSKEIYAGTEKGVYYSDDNGDSWENISEGLDFDENGHFNITSISVDSSRYLFAACENGGLYRSINPVTSIEDNSLVNDLPNDYILYQNYPNPFNPSTTIKYRLNVSSSVRLNVYDILGREIATIVNKNQKPGNYEVEWHADQYPSGVYFYKLEVGDYKAVKKMLLLK